MKKNLFFITVILLLTFVTTNVKAYTYSQSNISFSTLKNKGWIITWPNTNLKANENSTEVLVSRNNFYFNEAIDGSRSYVTYALGMSKSLPSTGTYELTIDSDFSKLQNNSNSLSDSQRELLKYLLVSGYHPASNTIRVDNLLNSKSDTLSMMAMQILVWEIVEGGRTSFNSISPNYTGEDSFYSAVVYPNGADSLSSDTLYGYYKKIVNNAYNTENPVSATAFNNSDYQLEWDSVRNRYSLNVTGLGNYTKCISDNENVEITTLDNGILITSDDEIEQSRITCSYYAGNYNDLIKVKKAEEFFHYKFNSAGSCSNNACQNLVYGSGYKLFSKYFNVTTENTKIKVRKIGIDKEEIEGSTFKITNRSTSNYTIIINGNDEPENINKSGEYIVSEIVAPKGYEKMSDFKIVVDSVNKRVTGCDSSGRDSKGNITCMNSQVVVTYDDDTIILNVIDVAKNFKIYSLDENNIPIKGITYQIKNSKDELVKFSLYDGNIYGYDVDGPITNIRLDSTASYPIALLPEGEYKIIETAAPYPYVLSGKESNNTTLIKINNNGELFIYNSDQKIYVSASNQTVEVKNYKTKVGVITTGVGFPILGAQYKLYKEDKVTEVSGDLTASGIYNYNSAGTTTTFISNSDGLIRINNLPIGTYYFKQVATITGYTIYDGFIEAVIDVNKKGNTVNNSNSVDTFDVSNSVNSFTFYKTDIKGEFISSGKFKLQRYNAESNKYVDVKISQLLNNGQYYTNTDIYTEDEENGRLQFTTSSGSSTFINMTPGTYRIVETVAPEGYERVGYKDTATVTIDANGNATGMLVLKNKNLLTNGSDASAELIVNIQTGQPRIMYALIIVVIVSIICLLIYLNRKKK